jgi:hypothetical protein
MIIFFEFHSFTSCPHCECLVFSWCINALGDAWRGPSLKYRDAGVRDIRQVGPSGNFDVRGFVRLVSLPHDLCKVREGPLVQSDTVFSQQHELLTGDALGVAVMQDYGSSRIASADTDFDRVPGITRYSPT